ncbi:MAG TPA: GDSL-type esterase/lipase family protein [Bordetella sp.]
MATRRRFLTALPLLGSPVLAGAATSRAYAVVIGDSIAEGEPNRHGRLNVNGQFVPDYPSQPGQLSYELAKYSGVFHVNHGIGGQVAAQVRQRWPRDVLAEDLDPGDGRGSRTLPKGRLPALVYLHVGINDIAARVPLQSMQDSFTYFAQTTQGRGLPLVIDNIGSWLGMPPPMVDEARAFNTWLVEELAPRHQNIVVADYLDWSSGNTGDYRVMAPGKFVDGLHPTMEGYQDFARYVHDTVKLPARSAVHY